MSMTQTMLRNFSPITCRFGINSRRLLSTNSNVFPWRHSAVALDRTVNSDDLSGQPQNSRASFFRYVLASRELNKSYWQIFLFTDWKHELAADFAYAFQMGVASILSERFQVPVEEIFNEAEATLDFNQSLLGKQSLTDKKENSSPSLMKSLLDETLWMKYQSLDPATVNMRLQIIPVNSRIEHAFVVPVITRASVKDQPSLKGSYRQMEIEFQKNQDIDQARKLAGDMIDATGNIGVRTVIVDVSIDCIEVYRIKDATTGEILHGNDEHEEGRPVTHLVRFEMVTLPGERGERVQSAWQVVDWDDLFENNQWY